jgi:cytosine/adenosine deaminase-related metal-dependent hydrolase
MKIRNREVAMSRMRLWAIRELRKKIVEYGGYVDCHRHLDRQDTFNEEGMRLIGDGATLPAKWELINEVKRSPAYVANLADRISEGVEDMMEQGIVACRTYIDVDPHVGLAGIEAAVTVREIYRELAGFVLQIAAYPIGGVRVPERRRLLESALRDTRGFAQADLIGGLPSIGRSGVGDWQTSKENMELLLSIANEHGKPLDLQVDQANDPDENETRLLAQTLLEFRRKTGYGQPVTATHAVSLSALRDDEELRDTIALLKEADIGVVVCPGAALSMKQDRSKHAPIHNSIAPVMELVNQGVTVGLGVDNASDIFMPTCDGRMETEVLKMLDAVRMYDLDLAARIASANGRKILGLEATGKE